MLTPSGSQGIAASAASSIVPSKSIVLGQTICCRRRLAGGSVGNEWLRLVLVVVLQGAETGGSVWMDGPCAGVTLWWSALPFYVG